VRFEPLRIRAIAGACGSSGRTSTDSWRTATAARSQRRRLGSGRARFRRRKFPGKDCLEGDVTRPCSASDTPPSPLALLMYTQARGASARFFWEGRGGRAAECTGWSHPVWGRNRIHRGFESSPLRYVSGRARYLRQTCRSSRDSSADLRQRRHIKRTSGDGGPGRNCLEGDAPGRARPATCHRRRSPFDLLARDPVVNALSTNVPGRGATDENQRRFSSREFPANRRLRDTAEHAPLWRVFMS
jgi:hypothetical protein